MRNRKGYVYCIFSALTAVILLASGCVSSTLESAKPEVEAKTPTYDLVARENAVAEMRAKAANVSGKKTNAYQIPETFNQPLTSSEANAKIQELNMSSSALAETLSDDEFDEKQRSIEAMRLKAQSHYLDALDKIEN